MSKLHNYIYASMAILLFGACNNDFPFPTREDGKFSLSVETEDIEVEVQTRTGIAGVDVNNFYISLKDNEGSPLMTNRLYVEMATGEFVLPAEKGYSITVESCSPKNATTLNNGFGAYRFAGEAVFDIEASKTTPVTVNCSMVNGGLKFIFDSSFTTKFPIHAVTTQDARAIVFNSNNQENIAYYDINGDNLDMAVKITGSTGGWDGRLDVTQNITLQKGKVIVVKLTYSDGNGVRMLNI
jgi:hypothetical protein